MATAQNLCLAVTGVPTGPVMLNSVTKSLPSVDYTVDIEWAYYDFIALAASTVVITLIGRRWNEDDDWLQCARSTGSRASTTRPWWFWWG